MQYSSHHLKVMGFLLHLIMKIQNIPIPEPYMQSADFRFFVKWFSYALTKIQYDTVNMADLYDALRCPQNLLWMLGDTMGYKYDDRVCAAFNRFVMLYFMSMIRHKGSQLGVTLAAEVNLKQKDINAYGAEKDILYNRLEDTSIPANSVYVESNVDAGYINVVYFTDEKPIDTCTEYVRPLGMYCFQYAGVRIDSSTKISVDARLAKSGDSVGVVGPTKVGHYTRNDYARLQHMQNESHQINRASDTRSLVYSRSSTAESEPTVNAGYRALNSLQMANNEHLVKSLFSQPIFDIGYGPTTETMEDIDVKNPMYNLRYNKTVDQMVQGIEPEGESPALGLEMPIMVVDPDREQTEYTNPNPKIDDLLQKQTPPPSVNAKITMEQGGYLLTEDGYILVT